MASSEQVHTTEGPLFKVDDGIDLLKTGRYSDFTVKCGDVTFPVHKVILYTKSPFFKTCIDGAFKEAQEATLTIGETQPVAVALLLTYVYTGISELTKLKSIWPSLEVPENPKVSVDPVASFSTSGIVRTYCQLYELSVRFLMPGLQRSVSEVILKKLELPQFVSDSTLRQRATMLDWIYNHTCASDGILRASATSYCVRHSEDMEKSKDVMEIMKRHEEYTWEVAMGIKRDVENEKGEPEKSEETEVLDGLEGSQIEVRELEQRKFMRSESLLETTTLSAYKVPWDNER